MRHKQSFDHDCSPSWHYRPLQFHAKFNCLSSITFQHLFCSFVQFSLCFAIIIAVLEYSPTHAVSATKLTIDDSYFDNLPIVRYDTRTYPEHSSEETTEKEHKIRHRRHHRTRRQFHFSSTSANISLGYGSFSEAESGPWGPWSELTECTRSCGGGVHFQTRICMDRQPSCIGPSKRFFSCNVHDCQQGTQDFRENQCSRFNSLPFEGQYYNWLPFNRVRNPCELNCMPEGQRFYVRQARKVIDGTRCFSNETTDICVDGVCVELGCDRILGSGLREDKCRRCGGDGSTCRTVQGVYTQNNGMQVGYNDILNIPKGATNIEIREVKPSKDNYLAIRNLAGTYYLNGDWRIASPSTFNFADTNWYYTRSRSNSMGRSGAKPESLRALGPTSEALLVVLLYQEPHHGIAYEYSVPFNVHQPSAVGISVNKDGEQTSASTSSSSEMVGSSSTKYSWIFGDYSACSKSCGVGVQRRNVFCALINHETGKQEPVQDTLCDPTIRPADSRPCTNDQPCPARWHTSEWSICSCVNMVQHRSVFCTAGEVSPDTTAESCPILPDSSCMEIGQRPVAVKKCIPSADCPQWIVSDWTECDSRCGQGVYNRTVRCGFSARNKQQEKKKFNEDLLELEPVKDAETLRIQKRETQTEASIISTTITDELTEVVTILATEANSILINENNEDRFVDDWQCDPMTKPLEMDSCFNLPCDETGSVEWIISSWSSCDVDCGSQMSTRSVVCSTRDGQVFDDHVCLKVHGGTKPPEQQPCSENYICSKSFWLTSEWSPCSTPCGRGIQTRHVLCARLEESTGKPIPDDDESKCDQQSKPPTSAECSNFECDGSLWLAGPLQPCTVPCGGGSAKRPLFCKQQNANLPRPIDSDKCDSELNSFSNSEQCNIGACDDDQIATIILCKDTEFGCCPSDSSTPADEDYRNCPILDANATAIVSNCEDSKYGCCSQSQIEALGPFGLGCPINCNNTKFGCCPDMNTIATDENHLIGCPVEVLPTTTTTTMAPPTTTTLIPMPDGVGSGNSDSMTTIGTIDCATTTYGCCPDGWNSAKGSNMEGCDDEDGSGDGSNLFTSTLSSILNTVYSVMGPTTSEPRTIGEESDDCTLSPFGCCPNGKTKATGERYLGCTCEDYPYGCCQDRYTPAGGENYEGCYCNRTLYGCCPDQVTPAIGENQEGCNCESSSFGCCSDMVTFARGPDSYGCPCDTLVFGCCPASSIPAKGPNFAGCTCAETPFGCCADGITVAYGPKFEGCPSGPSLDLKLASEVCSLPMEIGPCRNFSVKWYFDVSYGSCNRFWYGGCEGNGNRFPSQELCERACVKPEGPERCTLPKISGPCNSSQEAWYFDTTQTRCDRFLYGGCLGNTNRFESLDQCEEHCVHQAGALNPCEQPVSAGPCHGNYRRWYYRKEEGRCREFNYGGCQGNQNNFQSEAECRSQCNEPQSYEICALPKAEGPCLGNFPRWHFDQQSNMCREFTYSGCEGNHNRFVDRESCERKCNNTIPYQYAPGYPYPMAPRPPMVDHSQQPSYNYESVCALPKAEGPCRASIIQWYFNSVNQRCERFYYGGCEGNANRFNDRESCERQCIAPSSSISASSSDPCLETRDYGTCSDYSERFYYDVEDRRCHRFYYSGCGGNRNNYATLEECYARCERPREVTTSSTTESTIAGGQFQIDFCFKEADSGPCQNRNQIRWYYNRRDGVCKEFIYGGCGGNENRFESQYECQTKCWNSQDICGLPVARGSCSLNFTQWFYESHSNECFEFQYSGCHGNANRFSSKQACINQCRTIGASDPKHGPQSAMTVPQRTPVPPSITIPEQCRLPRESGPCHGYYQRWYYSMENRQCQMFIYGGCDGNMNRYNTFEHCDAVCNARGSMVEEGPHEGDSREVICKLSVESGPCEETRARWFYDAGSHTCLPFAYGGCSGNKNRFKTYEECISFCGGVLSKEMQPPMAPQPEIPSQSSYYQPQQPNYQMPQQPSPPHHASPSPPPPPPPPSSFNPADCEPVECNEEQCLLGIDYYHDSRGCPSCRCTNPCNDLQCSDDMSCALELYRDENMGGKARGHAECRLRNKPGNCPGPEDVRLASPSGPNANETNCIMQCRSDADCRGADKCCYNGCANVCYSFFGDTRPITQHHQHVQSPKPPYETDGHIQSQPSRFDHGHVSNPNYYYNASTDNRISTNDDDYIEEMEPEIYPEAPHHQSVGPVSVVNANESYNIPEMNVRVRAGLDAMLNCHVLEEQDVTKNSSITSNVPTTTVVWSRDGRELSSIMESNRFELQTNGSLLIRKTDSNDHGTYACVANQNAAQEIGYVQLQVEAPVRILPGPKNVIAQIGLSSYLQCNAIGFPDPRVTWYKDDKNLPLKSIKYRQFANFTLMIVKVSEKDSGVYTCQAFNGIGLHALWDVTLLLDSKPTQVDSEPEIVAYDPNRLSLQTDNVVPKTRVSGYLDRIISEIQLNPQEYLVGSTLSLTCLIRSAINNEIVNPSLLTSVTWFVNSDIPLSIGDVNRHHYRLMDGNSTLVVYHLSKTDSGEYRCRASTGPYAESTASTHIQVENIFVPAHCQDSPFFANCQMIVDNNYCRNPTYAKMCCRSCYISNLNRV